MKRILCIWLPEWPRQRSHHCLPPPELRNLADREALVKLAEWCERFSPIVGLEDAAEPESLLADVSGLAGLFGGEGRLAQRVADELQAAAWQARIALADSIGAAWAVAHYDRLARQQPIIAPPGDMLAALGPLPVESLRLAEPILELLARLGIVCVRQLVELPRASLLSRFGPQLAWRLDQALGTAPEVIVAIRPPLEFAAEWSLEYPTEQQETLELLLAMLVERVAALLAERGYGALQLICRLLGERGCLATLEVGLFQPSAASAHLLELLRMQWERLSLAAPVAGMVVSALRAATMVYRQQGLFPEDRPAEQPHLLAALWDRLASRLGRHAVVRPRLRADAQPELTWRDVPLVDGAARPRSGKPSSSAQPTSVRFGPLDRPLQLLARPLALHVLERVDDGPPLRWRLDREYVRARWWGPERIETGWWRKRAVRRDYYRVETTTGERLWIFQRLRDGQWFWQGEF